MSWRSLSDTQKGLFAALLTAVCWSFLALFLKFALKYADSPTIVWYRMVVAFTCMALWFLLRGQGRQLVILKSPPGPLLWASLALAFNYLGFMKGIFYTSPASAQIFIQLGPLGLALVGLFLFKENLSNLQKLGFGACVLGFLLFYRDRLQLMGSGSQALTLGMLWLVLAAAAWVYFATVQRTLLRVWQSSQINTYVYLVATLLYLPWVNWAQLRDSSMTLHLFYVFLGLNNLIAYGSLSIAIQYLPFTKVSPIITLNPLLTLLLIFLMEKFGWDFIPLDPISQTGLLGAVLALLGTVIVLSKKREPSHQVASSRVRL